MKKISIIVPVFNVKKYLDKCLQSITNQTYKNLEIILVDDGSTDGCSQLCDGWSKNDDRIIVIHKKNGGVSSARNEGLKIATGNYIGFVDADDTIDITMYQKLAEALEKDNSDIAMCKFYKINNIEEITYINENSLTSGMDEDFLKKHLFINNEIKDGNTINTQNIMGSTCRCLYSKVAIKDYKFNEDIGLCEDLLFYLDVIKKDTKISVVDEYLYHYYENSNSAVHKINEKKIKYYLNFMYEVKKRLEVFNEENKNLAMFSMYSNLIKLFLRLAPKTFKQYKQEIKKFVFNTKRSYREYKKYRTGLKNKIVDYLIHKENMFLLRILFKLKK